MVLQRKKRGARMIRNPVRREDALTDALETADQLRTDVNLEILDDRRSEFGQFMTPAKIARFMASLFRRRTSSIRLLDPGAAVGSLTAAFVDELCQRRGEVRTIDVTAFEVDPLLASKLRRTLSCCQETCVDAGISFTSTVVVGDFIESMVARLEGGLFDGYSLDRLFRFLNALGQEIEITVRGAGARKTSKDRAGVFVKGLVGDRK